MSNPIVPLELIPFNDDCDRLQKILGKYECNLFVDRSFARLQKIGEELELGYTSTGPFWFRRFAAFSGTFDRFLYLDCRTLVLSDVLPLIAPLDVYGFDVLHYDCALDQVFEPGVMRCEILRDTKTRGFNSGRWAARRGVFTIDELENYAQECVRLRDQMNPRNTDQFFLNYCCHRKGVKTGHFAEVLGDMCQDGWARQSGYVYKASGGYRRWDFGGLNHKKRVPLLHWAGIKLSPAMPEAELFYSFRDAEYGLAKRLLRRLGRMVQRPLIRLLQGLRANRWINEAYHRMRVK